VADEVEKILGHTFRNKTLLSEALTHRSFNEGRMNSEKKDNERLEFLGDSVINLVITEYLFKNFSKLNEGSLSKLKAHLVSTSVLAEIAQRSSLHNFIRLGKGEEKNNGRNNKRIIASLFEALSGAIYLDSGFKNTSSIIIGFFSEFLKNLYENFNKINDYKSELQEIIQGKGQEIPIYKLIKESGNPPETVFTSAVYLGNKMLGKGKGSNKRRSEQNAAYDALKNREDFFGIERLSEIFFIKND